MKIKNNLYKRLIYILVISLSTVVNAQVYQWKDEDGKIHYGDDPRRVNSDELKSVEINDKYSVPVAKVKPPIKNTSGSVTRRLVLNDVIMDMPGSDTDNILIGRVVCGRPVDLYWTTGVLRLEKEEIGPGFVAEIEKFGYSAAFGEVVREAGELMVSAKIKKIFVNTCTKSNHRKVSQDSTYVSIEWTVKDPLNPKNTHTLKTRGSHHALKSKAVERGLEKSFDESFSIAVRNILSDEKLIGLLNEKIDTNVDRLRKEQISVPLNFSGGSGSFESKAHGLKKRTVIVKTSLGHGSGVYISGGGYILTNAHVVGGEEEFQIITDDLTASATLVRKNVSRDVALLKVNDEIAVLSPVSISKDDVEIGADLYVIGTPLDMQFSHTVTKGIVSAKRKMRGLDFIQTDAAINRGNSGGPVFNKHGDLIAIAVSSVMNSNGASLNINYLIPIKEALDQLDVVPQGAVSSFFRRPDASIGKEDTFLYKIYEWMNTPVIWL